MDKKPFRKIVLFGLGIAALGLLIIAATHNVSKTITKEDQEYIYKIVKLYGYDWDTLSTHDDFVDEIADIRAIQRSILGLTSLQKQVPSNQTRDPKDLYTLRHAQCSDRSRVMDKMLRLAGFDSRVASVYGADKVPTHLHAFLSDDKSKVRSHSMVEAKTSKGWMMVDTNDQWIGLDAQYNPIDLETWQNEMSDDPQFWHKSNEGEIYELMKNHYTYVYGLYARHGYFYPPYNFIPDVSWEDLLENVK